MAAVAAVAINLAVMRSFEQTTAGGLSHLFFAFGVMPMASLLILVALNSVRNLVRGGRCSPFVLGFEALGWPAVFFFITCYSVAAPILLAYAELIGAYVEPLFMRYFAWAGALFELGFMIVIFSLPQLVAALLGGWLARKLGITIRFELEGVEPAHAPDAASPRTAASSSSAR